MQQLTPKKGMFKDLRTKNTNQQSLTHPKKDTKFTANNKKQKKEKNNCCKTVFLIKYHTNIIKKNKKIYFILQIFNISIHFAPNFVLIRSN